MPDQGPNQAQQKPSTIHLLQLILSLNVDSGSNYYALHLEATDNQEAFISTATAVSKDQLFIRLQELNNNALRSLVNHLEQTIKQEKKDKANER